ncbi:MAG: tetratricopeptide repeat protein [Myxococcota bacterium]|jgi:tetratricopeptide (TPR) repeat protein|nr:tetratricopeptide repeat protein [Myxococcota bacterium]
MRSSALRAVLCASIACSSAALVSNASAQDASYDAEARALFEAGRTAFDAGRYEDALQHFQGAYRRSQRPQLLFNVGVAADRAGRVAEAIAAYEKFLESVPEDAQRPWIETRLGELRALPPGGAMPPAPNPFAETSPPRDATPPPPDAAPAPTPAAPTTSPPARPAAEPPPTSGAVEGREELVVSPRSRVPGVLLLGVGAASVVGGAVAIGTAHSLAKQVRDTSATVWAEVEDDARRAPRREKIGFVLLGVGVVAIGAGLVQLVLPSERVERRAGARLRLGPTGVVLEGAF